MSLKQLDDTQVGHIKKICDDAGIKLTHQRLEIFRTVMASSDHPSAEEVYERLQTVLPTLALDTVYRTLATFDELGIVRKLHLMNERTLFDANLIRHHHFICIRCKAVEDLYWEDFDATSLPEVVQNLGQVQSRHLELHGVCNTCLAKNA
jgi:Fur family peroxide stress response transcriptional regulator